MSEEKLTAEGAKGLVEEVIGEKLDNLKKDLQANRQDSIKDLADAINGNKATVRGPEQVKADFAEMLGCLGATKGDFKAAEKMAKDRGNQYIAKALGSTSIAGGSVMIHPEFANEMIPLLRADAVVMASGARTVPMDSGILVYGRVGAGATAAYRGESVAAVASDPTLEELELRARILTVMTPASQQLLNRSMGRGAQFIQEELVAAATDKMDSAFIRSAGTSHEPKGLRYWADSANVFDEGNAAGTSGGSTLAEIINDLGKAMFLLMNANHKMTTPGWLFAPRTWKRLFTILDSNGNPVFQDELRQGTLYGIPYKVTTNIPINLTAVAGSGGGSDASEVYLVDFFNILVGETEALRLSVSTEGSYTTGGSLVSAFERGEVLTKVELEHDMIARHGGTEIAIIKSCTWGTV